MRPPESDGHPAHAAGDRVASHRSVMQQFDGNAFVETEFAQAPCFMVRKLVPIDGDDVRGLPQW